MKPTLRNAAFTAFALLASSTVVHAELSQKAVIDSLAASGYTATEIDFGASTVKAHATNGTSGIEVVYDRASGAVISQDTVGSDGSQGGAVSGSDDPAGHEAGDDQGGSGADDSGSEPDGGGHDGGSGSDSSSHDGGSDGGSDGGGSDGGSHDGGSDGGSHDGGSDSDGSHDGGSDS
jgi:hypothetical protein